MAKTTPIENDVRGHRLRLGWSQQDLAKRSGLSRTGVGAIESGRLVPSTAAALALAAALGCRVDELFRLARGSTQGPAWAWAWDPRGIAGRYWHAEVGGRTLLFPAEASPLGVIPHDGTYRGGVVEGPGRTDPTRTLVLSCCDPAVGLLADELARSAGIRLIVLGRSSRDALGQLGSGVAHVAGIHLSKSSNPDGNESAVREVVGAGFTLLRVAGWEEGIASSRKLGSIGEAVGSSLRWIGREAGSGARSCLDELLGERRSPRRSASNHRGVAEAIRSGWADAGVCLRLVSEEAGLDFLSVRQESFDLCFPTRWEDDPRLKALVQAVRSPSYRKSLGELPGYDSTVGGDLHRIN